MDIFSDTVDLHLFSIAEQKAKVFSVFTAATASNGGESLNNPDEKIRLSERVLHSMIRTSNCLFKQSFPKK